MRDSDVRDPRQADAGRPQGALPSVRKASPEPIGKRPTPSAPSKPAGVLPGSAALDVVLYSLKFGEAPRIGIVGDTGTGKSVAMRAICAEYLRRSVGIVFACDKAGASGFDGQRRTTVDDLRLHPMEREPRAVVFTGDVFEGLDPNPEQVAQFCWQLAARRVPTLQAVDELKWAAKNGWWHKRVKWLPQSCSEGRKHGVGIVWASQVPQDAPREAFDQAGVIVTYRLAGLPLDRLEERNYLNGIERSTIEQLPGDDSPPGERGRCVILRRGRPWDGKFCRFDESRKPTAGP